ncbi:MAG: hypothetical protein MJ152_02675 [Clostridia bacterium]|nr:hypothetical protein [Clostridia bacterium]
MRKTVTDRFGKVWDTSKLDLYWNEEDNLTLQDGTYIVMSFYGIDDAIEYLELTDKEIEKLEKEYAL